MKWWLVALAYVGLIIADRWLKILAWTGTAHDLGFAKFVLFKNDALVFSWPLPNSVAIIFMIVAILVILFVAWRMWRSRSTMALIGCGIILSGALSNLFDRIAYGYVIDWAYLGRWWPVFNLADVMIGAGLIMILLRRSGLTSKP